MDYSLLVGVDETNGELILGIVDYMRTYTLDKVSPAVYKFALEVFIGSKFYIGVLTMFQIKEPIYLFRNLSRG